MSIHYFRSYSTNPYYNLAYEQYLFEKKENGEIYILLWQNDNTVVIGRYQNAYEEVDLKYAQENKIRIVRRNSGGGAVYHDLGNLNYSFIVDLESNDLDDCFNLLENILCLYDIKYKFEGRNDITVDGFKVSGAACHIENGKVLYHGTLLINSNLMTLHKVLTRSTKISDSKSKKSVVRKVANCSDFTEKEMSMNDIYNSFQSILVEKKSIMENITDNKRIQELVQNKFKTIEWNFGFQPKYKYSSINRFHSGSLKISLCVANGRVKGIKFSGDFFAKKRIDILENRLVGCSVNHICEKLNELRAEEYFVGLSRENIIDCFDQITLPDFYKKAR